LEQGQQQYLNGKVNKYVRDDLAIQSSYAVQKHNTDEYYEK